MKAMQCDQAGELIGAYLDQELDAETRRDVAAHIGACPACAAAADELRRMNRQLASMGRERAPGHLASAVRSLLAGTTEQPPQSRVATAVDRLLGVGWLRYAAALLLVAGLAAALTAIATLRAVDTAALERDVAAAHVRSLLQDSPTQVASSEAHTVKPWFNGRLDFAPVVKDFAPEGFPLAGGRLDYVGERLVAALVYRRRLHIVNVFLWPAADGVDTPPREIVHRGYNIIAWNKAGITYWAISDLNMGELRELQSRL